MDALDALSAAQSEALAQYCSVTGREDLDAALDALQSSGWDLQARRSYASHLSAAVAHGDSSRVQLAAARAFEETSRSPRFERLGIDEPAIHGGPRGSRRTAQARNQPQGPLDTLWLRLRPYLGGPLALVSWPLSLAFAVVTKSLSFVARLLRIRPSFSTISFRGGGTTRSAAAAAADPTSCAERFVRSLEEQAGTGGLPHFERSGYEEALRKAHREIRPMLAILVSDEHDDTPDFKKSVLTDPELRQCLEANHVVVWGGDVRDRDAFISAPFDIPPDGGGPSLLLTPRTAATTLEATTFPFIACITLQPPRASPGVPAPRPQTPKMTLFSRLEGPPSSVTSAAAIISHLNAAFLPRTSAYLDRLRAERSHREAERRLRADQDAAYAAAGQRDAERIATRRAEALAAEASERHARSLDQWRRWAATSLAPEPTAGGVRLAVKLSDGRRIVRRFAETTTTVSDVYKWIEAQAFAGATQGSTTFPAGYEHHFDFRVAQVIPRRTLDVDGDAGSRTLAHLGGLSGGANLVVEGLRLGTTQEDSSDEDVSS